MGSDRDSDRPDWAAHLAAVAVHADRAAFAALFAFFAPRIKAFMRRAGESDAQAEELAQEAMLTVWRKAALFDPSTTGAAAWIFTIARNLRIDAQRRARRAGTSMASGAIPDAAEEFEIDDAPLPDHQLASAQSSAQVRSAMAKLSPEQIRVVEMSFFEEKPHTEIAEALSIPIGTVKSRLRLAMKRLRSLLGEA